MIATFGIFDTGEAHDDIALALFAFEPDGTRAAGQEFTAVGGNRGGG